MKEYGLILLSSIPVLILMTSVSVLVLLSSIYVLVLFTAVFVGVLTLIWSILMLESISKISVDNGSNHWMGFIHICVWCLYSFKVLFRFGGECGGVVDRFVAGVQTFYILSHGKSCNIGDASSLTVPWCIYLWGCWFFLFDLSSILVHFLLYELWGENMEEVLLHQCKRVSQGLELWVQVLLFGDLE